jgi:hypothetical protein
VAKLSKYKNEQQDTDDGLLFFHTHSLWEALNAVEKFYECKIYGVLDIQEVEENIQLYADDDTYSNIPKRTLLDAIDYAYNDVESDADYEIYLDRVREYIENTRR